MEAKINAPGLDADVSREDDPYAQVGLGLYQTDGDWIGVYQTRNGDNGTGRAGPTSRSRARPTGRGRYGRASARRSPR